MKKNNLKRYLASLLAVLMLASATGMSPAVFAEGEDILPQTEGGEVVQPELKKSETPIEVRITSDMKDEDVLAVLAEKLIENKNEIDPQSLDWTYTCAVMGSYVIMRNPLPTMRARSAEVSAMSGDTQIVEKDTNTPKPYYTATYKYPALKDNADGQYTLHLNGKDVVINKVSKYTSTIVFKENATITYNMDANNMKQQIFANAIDWEKSVLPTKDTLNFDDFEYQYKALPVALEKVNDKIDLDSIRVNVDIKGYKGVTDLTTFEQMGAGDQVIRVKFNGSDDYKASGYFVNEEFKVEKANVKVSVPLITKIYAGTPLETEEKPYATLDPNDPAIDIYKFFVGENSNFESVAYIDLPSSKTKLIDAISNAQVKFLKYDEKDTIRGKLQNGVTIGELKAAMTEIVNYVGNDPALKFLVNLALKNYGITVDNLKDLVDTLNKITKIADNFRIALGAPNHAGAYIAFAIAVNDNYNPAYAAGSVVVLKNWKGLKLEKNPDIFSDGKITVSEAKAIADGEKQLCILTQNGEPLNSSSAGAIHYWFTGFGKIYAKSEMPTAPGKYIVTASVRGGDFFAMPKTFVFTIVADPTPEVTPET